MRLRQSYLSQCDSCFTSLVVQSPCDFLKLKRASNIFDRGRYKQCASALNGPVVHCGSHVEWNVNSVCGKLVFYLNTLKIC